MCVNCLNKLIVNINIRGSMIRVYRSKKPYLCTFEFNSRFCSISRICPASCSSCIRFSCIISPASAKCKVFAGIFNNLKSFRNTISEGKICCRAIYSYFTDNRRFMFCFFRCLHCNTEFVRFHRAPSAKSLCANCFSASKYFPFIRTILIFYFELADPLSKFNCFLN